MSLPQFVLLQAHEAGAGSGLPTEAQTPTGKVNSRTGGWEHGSPVSVPCLWVTVFVWGKSEQFFFWKQCSRNSLELLHQQDTVTECVLAGPAAARTTTQVVVRSFPLVAREVA